MYADQSLPRTIGNKRSWIAVATAFVFRSAGISAVDTQKVWTTPFSTSSRMKKCLTSMCFERWELTAF